MTKTKTQLAQEYAENVINAFGNNGVPCGIEDIKQMIATSYVSGHTAYEQSMWHSVEDESPEFGQKVIIRASCESYYGEQFDVYENLTFEGNRHFGNSFKLRESADKGIKMKITHWMPIPELPSPTQTQRRNEAPRI